MMACICFTNCLCACRTRVKARHYSRKVPAMGTFRGAKVTRGADWQWGNQDGESLVKMCMNSICSDIPRRSKGRV